MFAIVRSYVVTFLLLAVCLGQHAGADTPQPRSDASQSAPTDANPESYFVIQLKGVPFDQFMLQASLDSRSVGVILGRGHFDEKGEAQVRVALPKGSGFTSPEELVASLQYRLVTKPAAPGFGTTPRGGWIGYISTRYIVCVWVNGVFQGCYHVGVYYSSGGAHAGAAL